ncbi:hypothetical protein [Marinisporobacter balticus]|uniref:Uncharacterized protein n=1 Tax=Marinisporobacter balticus TaxID=2018667 RepID=A0A4R2K7Y9_9FIRM|nr:hypothetical protein [Marinisporobacter balticus]TCO69483.1 hypothetical protein EV214_1317 [Marinisporobacter balticus]
MDVEVDELGNIIIGKPKLFKDMTAEEKKEYMEYLDQMEKEFNS